MKHPASIFSGASYPYGPPDDRIMLWVKPGKDTMVWGGRLKDSTLPLSDLDNVAAGNEPRHGLGDLKADILARGKALGGPGQRVLVYIDAKGKAKIAEGNHRVWALRELRKERKIKRSFPVPVELHYKGNSDLDPGAWMPKSKLAEPMENPRYGKRLWGYWVYWDAADGAIGNPKKSKAKKKKARAAKKRRQQRSRDKGVDLTKEGNVVAEMLLRRRMGTGGSGYHEPSRRQLERSSRRQEKQKGYTRDNAARKLKTFKAGRAPVRWRTITQSLPSSAGFVDEEGVRWVPSDGDYLWIGYTKIPPGVLGGGRLSELEQLSQAYEPDYREGEWSQHVMIAKTHLHPREWKKSLHEWRGPDPDRFRWFQTRRALPDALQPAGAGEDHPQRHPPQERHKSVSPVDWTSLKPGQAKFKLHKTFVLAKENSGRPEGLPTRAEADAYSKRPGLGAVEYIGVVRVPGGWSDPEETRGVIAHAYRTEDYRRDAYYPGTKGFITVFVDPSQLGRTLNHSYWPEHLFKRNFRRVSDIEALAWETRNNPSRYGSTPNVGHAEHEVHKNGFDDIVFVKKGAIAYGPVLVFTATRHRQHYNITVGRWNRTDRLDVRASRAQTDPQLSLFKKNPHTNYRSAVISMPSSAQLRGNPGLEAEYDPREEAARSMRQGIYESYAAEALGKKGKELRNRSGKRMDRAFFEKPGPYKVTLYKSSDSPERVTYHMPDDISAFMSEMLFRQTSKRVERAGLLGTSKAAERSQERYQDLDHLIENRQDYEETLGMGRKGGFYRVTEEPTRDGARWFVWPLPPGERLPGPGSVSQSEAESVANRLNRTANPLRTRSWWVPQRGYTKAELGHWLPRASDFGASGSRAVAPKKPPRPRRRSRARATTPTEPLNIVFPKLKPGGAWGYFLAGDSTEYPDFNTAYAVYLKRGS